MEKKYGTRVHVHRVEYGDCPYLPGRFWTVLETEEMALSPELYEDTLPLGWRRSGNVFYKNVCRGCGMCIPIRLDSHTWHPSTSQRRLESRNSDVLLSVSESEFSEESFELYRRYQSFQHDRISSDSAFEILAYQNACCSGFSTAHSRNEEQSDTGSMVTEYRLRDSGRLIATGYIDILPEGISSVYFAFDPVMRARSLGTWSVSREIGLAKELGKRWYYLGFWVPGSPKMDYKARFRPFEISPHGTWIEAGDRSLALDIIGDHPGREPVR